jgi:hypothetical protein
MGERMHGRKGSRKCSQERGSSGRGRKGLEEQAADAGHCGWR